jgi:phosphoglycerate dehydrogenase-like enzyme
MSRPKILIFAPREEPAEIIRSLEDAGYEVALGDQAWHEPRSNHEGAVTAAAHDAVALMGTSIRSTALTRRIMEASQRLRVIAKYTVGVDGIDTEASWCATRRPRRTASVSPKPPSP